jgi:6-phosphogluconolactonase
MPHRSDKTSRREFLTDTAVVALADLAFTRIASTRIKHDMRPVWAYVGTYSSPEGPEGSMGRGKGIYLFEMNPASGALFEREVFPSDVNPSWLALDPSRGYLYSANEISNYGGTDSGSVSAYAIDRPSGHLTLLNTVSSEGAGPAHLIVHPSGKYVFVANYHGGTVAVLPVRPNGALAPASDVKRDRGDVGPIRATSAPPGSLATSGHDKPHAHMIQTDPAGKFVIASDLGLDRLFIWRFDADQGKLVPLDPGSVALPPGDGPRHFAFHPSGRWLYSLQEEGSTVVTYRYDAVTGKLTPQQTIPTLPKQFQGTNFTSEVRVSPDAKFLYAANRLHDSIAWFSISEGGMLTFCGEEWTRGDYPRSFTIEPAGNYLYSCNQRADAMTTYRINRETGALSFVGQYTPVGTPAVIVFLV